jgi:hypothetical protein
MAEARCSGQGLARAVNLAGAESGLVLRYDRTAVAHWLAGTRPSAAVAGVVAECLTRTLDRSIHPDEVFPRSGREPPAPGHMPAQPSDISAHLVELAEEGPRQRAVVYSVTAGVPDFTAPLGPPAPGPGPVGSASATARTAELLTPVFSEIDAMHGGGRVHAALTAFLASEIAPWLHAPGRAGDRHRFLRAAARLAYLAGHVCFDEHRNGQAQRYLRIAAELFAEAGDLSGYTTSLRAMSIQAHHLDHHGFALDLATAAGAHSTAVPPGQAAVLHAQLAVAAAGYGDRRRALAYLGRAEQLHERAQDGWGTIGAFHPAALAHQKSEVLAALGDRAGAIAALNLSLRHRPASERRARAITTAKLAELHLQDGHVEMACSSWHAFLDDLPYLSSARAGVALSSLRSRLRPYQRVPDARTLLVRTHDLPRST